MISPIDGSLMIVCFSISADFLSGELLPFLSITISKSLSFLLITLVTFGVLSNNDNKSFLSFSDKSLNFSINLLSIELELIFRGT